MKVNVKHILEGISNSIFVKEEVEKIAASRMEICSTCPKNSDNRDKSYFEPGPYFSKKRPDIHCTMCACNLHAKVRSLHTSCPIEKWGIVASKEESAKIAMVTEDENSKLK